MSLSGAAGSFVSEFSGGVFLEETGKVFGKGDNLGRHFR